MDVFAQSHIYQMLCTVSGRGEAIELEYILFTNTLLALDLRTVTF